VPSRGASKGRINSISPAKILVGENGEARVCVPIKSSTDILEARKLGREIAGEMGFSSMDCTLIATAISELARNIVLYAQQGEIQLCPAVQTTSTGLNSNGIVIVAHDQGPGIRDLRSALQDGFSTSRGLGLGLPGVKRIMDDFDIVSKPREGTTVTVKKWKP
jgi:serine/threonine-protein kinase RsbT